MLKKIYENILIIYHLEKAGHRKYSSKKINIDKIENLKELKISTQNAFGKNFRSICTN